ncbi:hypothetical protein [Tardiphaga sp.]|uniref:hypothetical protein n=1 Tax=Tardiphaga sp. TaxID=1926292 RepID=UPI00262B4397|nr:hypothetical protein [Tardiphaga sp.]
MMKLFDLVQKLLTRRWGGTSRPPMPAARRTLDAGVQPPAQSSLCAAAADTLRKARQDALNAEQDVIQISRAHLATLMASPPRIRMAHLNDPELTFADQTELASSVRSALPVSFRLAFRRWRPTGLIRRLRRACSYKCIMALVVLVACGVPGLVAWCNTGTRIVGSDQTWLVDWHLPDNTILHGAWNARSPAVAMQAKYGTVVLRHWLNGRGYAATEVNERWLLKNSFTYVTPTGATGAANPANR